MAFIFGTTQTEESLKLTSAIINGVLKSYMAKMSINHEENSTHNLICFSTINDEKLYPKCTEQQ